MLYKNTTNSTKIFYGVKFKPNEIKEVQGYINTPGFIKVENNTININNINNTNKGKTRREKIDNNTKAEETAQTALDEIGGFKKVEKENNANVDSTSTNINTNINTVKGVEKTDKTKEEKAIENSRSGDSNNGNSNNKVISESKTSEK